jgi:hypothetical protein
MIAGQNLDGHCKTYFKIAYHPGIYQENQNKFDHKIQ